MNYTFWKTKFEEIINTYKVIDDYISDSHAIQQHLRTKEYIKKKENPNSQYTEIQNALPFILGFARLLEMDREDKQISNAILEGNDLYHSISQATTLSIIKEFKSQFIKQIIVLQYSHLYDFLKEYFKDVLRKNPKRLSTLINEGTEKQGYIKFITIIDINNIQEIIEQQVMMISAQIVEGGKFKSTFEKIKTFGKKEIPNELRENLNKGHELRNKIIHEITNPNIEIDLKPEEIHTYFLQLIDILENRPLQIEEVKP